MYSKVEFIPFADYDPVTLSDAQITALAAAVYTDLYDCDMSELKTLGLTDYFGNEPKTFDFTLDYDSWLENVNTPQPILTELSQYIIRIYDNTTFVFSGVILLNSYKHNYSKQKVKLKAYDWLYLLNKLKDFYLICGLDNFPVALSVRETYLADGIVTVGTAIINGTTCSEMCDVVRLAKFIIMYSQGLIWQLPYDYLKINGVDDTYTDSKYIIKPYINITPFQTSNAAGNFLRIGGIGGGCLYGWASQEAINGNDNSNFCDLLTWNTGNVNPYGIPGINIFYLVETGFLFNKNNDNVYFLEYWWECAVLINSDLGASFNWRFLCVYTEFSEGVKIGDPKIYQALETTTDEDNDPTTLITLANTFMSDNFKYLADPYFIGSGSGEITVPTPAMRISYTHLPYIIGLPIPVNTIPPEYVIPITTQEESILKPTSYKAIYTLYGSYSYAWVLYSDYQTLSDTLPLKRGSEISFTDILKSITIGSNGSFIISLDNPDEIKFINKYSDSVSDFTIIADDDVIDDLEFNTIEKLKFSGESFENALVLENANQYINLLTNRYNEFYTAVNTKAGFTVSELFNTYGLEITDKISILGKTQVINGIKKESEVFHKINSMNYIMDYWVDELANYITDELGNKIVFPAF